MVPLKKVFQDLSRRSIQTGFWGLMETRLKLIKFGHCLQRNVLKLFFGRCNNKTLSIKLSRNFLVGAFFSACLQFCHAETRSFLLIIHFYFLLKELFSNPHNKNLFCWVLIIWNYVLLRLPGCSTIPIKTFKTSFKLNLSL